MLLVVTAAIAAGIGRAPDAASRDASLAAIGRLAAKGEAPPPQSPDESEHIQWMTRRANAQQDLAASIEVFLSQYPDDPERVRLESLQMDACFDAATMLGESLAPLDDVATLYAAEGESNEAVRDAEYWLLLRELQRLEALALRGQINTADRLAAMEGFAFKHTASIVSVPIMAELIEGWTQLGDFVRADDWLAVLKERHPTHVTTRAIEGRRLLQRAIGTAWRPEMADVMGRPINWQQFDGSVTLVIFWSTTHRLSVEASDFVRQLDKSLAVERLRVIGVSLDNDSTAAFEATVSRSSDWTAVCDGMGWSGTLPQTYGIRSLPTLLLLDGQGVLQRFWTPEDGACSRPEVEQAIRRLVGEWHATGRADKEPVFPAFPAVLASQS